MKGTPIFTFLAVIVGLIFASGALALEKRGGAMTGGGSEALIGSEVRDADGNKLGHITEMRMNGVAYAKVKSSATDQTYLVPAAALRGERDGRFVTVHTDDQMIDRFYGVAPHFGDEARLLTPDDQHAVPRATEVPPVRSID